MVYLPPREVPGSLVAEPNKVGTTGLTDTSALCSAPVQPAIEMQQAVRHRACVASEVIQGSNPGT
ncbi:TPA: hypothetical protein I4D70_19130 [Enterobacter asburiae]|nr:hypothetical protein [Enterobacter asburiae]